MSPIEERILTVIKARMPPIAVIDSVPRSNASKDLIVTVSWDLNDDPERPHKKSKTISIWVENSAARDLANKSVANQDAAYGRVETFLSENLKAFEPQHDSPKSQSPPEVKWVIGSEVLDPRSP